MKLKILIISLMCFFSASMQACQRTSSPEQTTITPHLEGTINPNNNLVYCASFQIAWNIMHDQVIKGDIFLESDPPLAQRLNRQLQKNNDISADAYVATAGELSQEFISKVNKELSDKFGNIGHGFSMPREGSGSKQIAVYASMFKNLEFSTAFEKLDHPISFTTNARITPVKAFGIESFSFTDKIHKKLYEQVIVLDYRDDNDFILSLTSKAADDQIILAKIVPEKTLLQTYAAIKQRLNKSKPTNLLVSETLQIPKVDFDLTNSFNELEKKRIMNKGWEGWFLSQAVQNIRFKLDEKGAILRSWAFLTMEKAENPPAEDKPRKFIFDKPFLIFLKQNTGEFPYFAMWVNNPELLVKE